MKIDRAARGRSASAVLHRAERVAQIGIAGARGLHQTHIGQRRWAAVPRRYSTRAGCASRRTATCRRPVRRRRRPPSGEGGPDGVTGRVRTRCGSDGRPRQSSPRRAPRTARHAVAPQRPATDGCMTSALDDRLEHGRGVHEHQRRPRRRRARAPSRNRERFTARATRPSRVATFDGRRRPRR